VNAWGGAASAEKRPYRFEHCHGPLHNQDKEDPGVSRTIGKKRRAAGAQSHLVVAL
jgi:hypothetical protein